MPLATVAGLTGLGFDTLAPGGRSLTSAPETAMSTRIGADRGTLRSWLRHGPIPQPRIGNPDPIGAAAFISGETSQPDTSRPPMW